MHETHGPVAADTSQRARLQDEIRRRMRERGKREDAVARVSRDEPAALSFAQQRLWVLDRIEPGRVDYNSGFALDLRGDLDAGALGRALTALVHRHESLRTTFTEVDGQGHQVVGSPFDLAPEVVGVEGEEELADLVGRRYRDPFDLETGPLVRAHLFRAGARRHVLLVALHHIVTDGWSLGVLQGELRSLYARALGEPRTPAAELAATLEPLPFQYPDYAAWQRERLSGEGYERSLEHWRGRLAGAQPLQLPTDRPRPPARSMRGDSHGFGLPTGVVARLERLGREHNANLYMVLLTGVRIAMARWTRQDDVVLGTVTAGRQDPRLHALTGFFVNTLALRGRVDERLSFSDNLSRTRDETLADFDHAEVPFDAVVDAVLTERDPAVPPLVQAAVVLQNAGGEAPADLEGLEVRAFPVQREHAVFDLTLEFQEGADGLSGSVEFNTDIFDEATVARFVADLRGVLESAEDPRPLRCLGTGRDTVDGVGDADGGVARVGADGSVVGNASLERGPEGPAPRTVVEAVAEQVGLRPDAPALAGAEGELSYAEVDERAARVAGYLRAHGVRRGDRVGVCLERGTELGVLFLAVLYAGAVYVPLDPSYPAARLARVTEDAALTAVLATPTASAVSNGTAPPEQTGTWHGSVPVLCPDRALGGAPHREPVTVHDPAYMIHTSGSTGRPKGVVVPHHGLAALAGTLGRRAQVEPGARWLQFASPSFDAFISELTVALFNGATSVLPPRDELVGDLPAVLRRYRISHVLLPPALLPGLSPQDLEPVEHLFVGGEFCPGEMVARFSRGRRMYNLYGPTESTVCATMSPPLSGAGTPPLGTPVDGTRVLVLDRWLRPVSDGVPGELYIGGDGLAHGYWNRPGLSSVSFVADPFGPPGARMYRSGDVVRRRPDGELEFLGRSDAQVKVRGHRIEPGEVEAVLHELPGVDQAVVTVDDGTAGRRLVAHVVAAGPENGNGPEPGTGGDAATGASPLLSPTALAERASSVLPGYMVPSAFVVVDRIPLTPNGKTDRAALPPVDWSQQSRTGYTAPRTRTERELADLWCELLGLEHVGVYDDFFRSGGDSIGAVRMVARAADTLGTRLPVREVFDHPTIAELAELFTAQDAGGGAAWGSGYTGGGGAVVPVPRENDLPLSAGQRRLWFLDRYEPGGSEYNSGGALRLTGPLDTSALNAALDALVHRHESLRTTFSERDGRPVQVIAASAQAATATADLSHVEERGREAALDDLLSEFVHRPFDLAAGPLFRALVVTLGPTDHVLALGIHHIVVDAWSLSVLTRELGLLYRAATSARSPLGAAELVERAGLAPLGLDYADFAAWQDSYLDSEAFERELQHWKDLLSGAEPLALPTDRPRPPVRRGRGDTRAFRVHDATLAGVRTLEADHGLTLFMVLTAAVQVALARYTGQRDIVLGTVTSGRDRAELEGMVGFFVNTLALRTRVDESLTGSELLASVRENLLTAFQHGDVPFDTVVDAVAPHRDPSRPTLVQAVVSMQNAPGQSWRIDGLTVAEQPLTRHSSLFDLSVDFYEEDGVLHGSVEYDTDLFEPVTIDRFAGHVCELLAGLAASPDAPVYTVEMVRPAERAALLAAGRAVDTPERPRGAVGAEGHAPGAPARAEALDEQGGRSAPGAPNTWGVQDSPAQQVTPDTWNTRATPTGTAGAAGTAGTATPDEARRGHPLDALSELAVSVPDRPALSDMERTLSFGELDDHVNRLARHLAGAGVGPGDRVATVLSRGNDAVVGLFAVLRAGAAYVPVDPAAPEERARGVLDRSGAVRVLTDRACARAARATVDGRLPVTVVDEAASEPGGAFTDADRTRELHGQHPAYVMFTSGSTGVPKGVVVTHDNLAGMAAAYRATVFDAPGSDGGPAAGDGPGTGDTRATAGDPGGVDVSTPGTGPAAADAPLAGKGPLNAAHVAAWTFDASWDPLVWLLNGHHLHIVDERTRTDAEALCGFLHDRRIDYLDSTPSYLAQLVAAGLLDRGRHPLAVLTTGAEALDGDLAERLTASGAGTVVHNFYGPTENTVNSTVWRVRAGTRTLIGRPVVGTGALVLDRWLRPVPPGVHGELYLKGGCLAQGYDAAPGTTAAHFIADPYGRGGRLYRTGDLVRWTDRGELEFIGRNDDQVKLRGFRIELGEVEAVLASLEGVRAASAVVREDRPGVRRLVGYVVPDEGAGDTGSTAVREGAARHLPDYMVPAAVVVLGELPLNANGKTDRRALPAPDDQAFDTAGYVAPSGPAQELLAGLWGELLGLERVGAHDNFFDLGGDSILSIQLVSRVRAAGRELTSRDVFLHQSLAAMAAAVDQQGRQGPDTTGPVSGEVTPTPVQRWFLDTHPHSPEHFDMSLLAEIAPGTDPGLLARAAEHLAAHHDMLRLRVERDGTQWHQHLDAPPAPGSVRVVRAPGLSETGLDRLLAREAGRARPASRLSEGPLFEAVVVDTGGDDRHRLLLSAHHMVVDGVSWRVLLEDLSTVYQQLRDGLPVDLGARTTPFPVWAERLAEFTRQGGFAEDLPAWAAIAAEATDAVGATGVADTIGAVEAGTAAGAARAGEAVESAGTVGGVRAEETTGAAGAVETAGAPYATAFLPVELSGGRNDVASQDTVFSELSEAETEALVSRLPGALRCRMDDMLLAALGRVLSGWSGSPRVLIEKEGHGREDLFEDVDLSRTVGWFTTIYPVLLELPEETDWASTVTAVKRQLRGAPAGIGFGALRYLDGRPETEPLRRMPQVPVSFNYLGRFSEEGGDGLVRRFAPVPASDHAPQEERTNLLDVTGSVASGRMGFSWIYSTNRHRRQTVERLAGGFTGALREMVAQAPNRRGRRNRP